MLVSSLLFYSIHSSPLLDSYTLLVLLVLGAAEQIDDYSAEWKWNAAAAGHLLFISRMRLTSTAHIYSYSAVLSQSAGAEVLHER